MAIGEVIGRIVLGALRTGGLCITLPGLSAESIPRSLKATLIFLIFILVMPEALSHATPGSIVITVPALAGEVCIGAVLGCSLWIYVELCGFVGQIAGLQSGLTMANIVDPSSKIDANVFATCLTIFGSAVLLTAGTDRAVLRALFDSFLWFPIGAFRLDHEHLTLLGRLSATVVVSALQFALPVLSTTLILEIATGLTGRLVPQLGASSVSIPMKFLATLIALCVSLHSLGNYARYSLLQTSAGFWRVISLSGVHQPTR